MPDLPTLGLETFFVREFAWFQAALLGVGGKFVLAGIRLAMVFVCLRIAKRGWEGAGWLRLFAAAQFLAVLTAPLAPALSWFTLLGNGSLLVYFFIRLARAQRAARHPERTVEHWRSRALAAEDDLRRGVYVVAPDLAEPHERNDL